MKKVAILTFHDTTNFGATLQAVATYKVLNEMGFKVDIIDYRCDAIDARELPPRKYDLKKFSIVSLALYIFSVRKQWKKYHCLHDFLLKKVTMSPKLNRNTIKEIEDEYDLFLVGSDMLWCMKNTNYDLTYVLDFVDNPQKKYAFATSSGYDPADVEVEIFRKYLSDFSGIAVRESRLSSNLEAILNRYIPRVCDPTMLIKPEWWRQYVKKDKSEKYVLVYMDTYDRSVSNAALEYAEKKELSIYIARFNHPFRRDKQYKVKELYSISDFLSAIYNAQSLYTASYHGMLFAIYFHVPFVYFNKDSSRLEEVARIFGLEKRNGGIYNHMEQVDIDWDTVDKKRECFLSESYSVLREMLPE